VLNTAAFPLPAGAKLPRSLWWARNTNIGALLIRGANSFCRLTARWGATKPMPAEVRRMYLAPYDSWKNRIAVLRFVQAIPLSPSDPGYDIVRDTGDRLRLLRDKPALLCWGMHDFVFDEHFLNEWQRRFPNAEIHRFADAGHYVLEDAGADIIARIRDFLNRI
jgi:pimeloyl-ACP methyl ester carboxylesterase